MITSHLPSYVESHCTADSKAGGSEIDGLQRQHASIYQRYLACSGADALVQMARNWGLICAATGTHDPALRHVFSAHTHGYKADAQHLGSRRQNIDLQSLVLFSGYACVALYETGHWLNL